MRSPLEAPARALLLGALSVSAGCVDLRQFDLSVVSNRSVALGELDPASLPVERRVEGEEAVWTVLSVPLGTPTLEGAVDDALAKGDGDLMVDAVVRRRAWSALLFGRRALVVTGDVYRTRDSGGTP